MVESKNLKLKLGLCGLALTSFLAINAHSTVHADTVQDNANNQNAITWDSDSDDSQVVKEDSNQEEPSQSVQTQAPAVQSAPVQNKAVQPVQKQAPVQSNVQNRQSQSKVATSNVSSSPAVQNRAEKSIVRQSNVDTSTVVNRLNTQSMRNNRVNANLKIANVNATSNQGVNYTNELTADEYNDWANISDDRLKDMTFETKLWVEDSVFTSLEQTNGAYDPIPSDHALVYTYGSDPVYLKGSQLVSYGVSLNDLRKSAIHSYKQDILGDHSDTRLYKNFESTDGDLGPLDYGYILMSKYVANPHVILNNLAKNVKFTNNNQSDTSLYDISGKSWYDDAQADSSGYGLTFEVANDSKYNYSRSVAYVSQNNESVETGSSTTPSSTQYNPVRLTNPNDNQVIVHFVKTNGQSIDDPNVKDQVIDLTKLGQKNYNVPSGYTLANPNYTSSETKHDAKFSNMITADEYNNWTRIPDQRLEDMTYAVQLFVLNGDSMYENSVNYNNPDPNRNPDCAKGSPVYMKGSQLLKEGFSINDLRQSAVYTYESGNDSITRLSIPHNPYYGEYGTIRTSDCFGYVMQPQFKSNAKQILQNLANDVTFKGFTDNDLNAPYDLKSKLDTNIFAVVIPVANPTNHDFDYTKSVHDGYTFQDNSGQVKSVVGNHVNIAVTKPQNVDPNSSNCKRQAQRVIHVTFPNGVKPESYDSITDSAGNKLTLDSNNNLTQTVTFTRSVTVDGLTGATLNQTPWQQHGAINAVTLPDIPGYTMTQS